MSWACHNYHPATKKPPREEAESYLGMNPCYGEIASAFWGYASFKTELKIGLKMRLNLQVKTWRNEMKFSEGEVISASVFARASTFHVMGLS